MKEAARLGTLEAVGTLPADDLVMPVASPAIRLALPLFATTIFLASGLLFLMQPMIARMLLPGLGGSPAVWNTCVLFFQAVLLAGYLYTHLAPDRLGSRAELPVHGLVLLAPLAFLPLQIRLLGEPDSGAPVTWVFVALTVSVALPFFAVSTSAPLLQRWFSRTSHPAAGDPYFLYAASNAGSISALLAYPVLVEPLLGLSGQSRLWTGGYLVLLGLTGICAIVSRTKDATQGAAAVTRVTSADLQTAEPLPLGRTLRWIALSFVPSSLMLGVTRHLSTDIAAVPLLWVVPLTLYLLTFVLAFSTREIIPYRLTLRALPLFVVPLVIVIAIGLTQPFWYVLPLHLGVFFLAALVCHTELAKDRPSVEHLTAFYLWMSVGGALGGVFNTLVAPLMFSRIAEYPIALVLACLLRPRHDAPTYSLKSDLRAVLVVAIITALVMIPARSRELDTSILFLLLGLPSVLWFSFSRQPVRFALAAGVILTIASLVIGNSSHQLHIERTFFGVYRVTEESGKFRSLMHGTTLHGKQSLVPEQSGEPLTYYHRTGPIGRVFAAEGHRLSAGRIGAIGLGTGSLAAYITPAQQWTFFEIDPAVVRIASNPQYFTYLAQAPVAPRIVLGDARLSLKRAPAAQYDLLILDAFSSDAIPVHLMTREAVALYLSKLAPGGLLAFHVSNRHLRLQPVLGRIGAELQLAVVGRLDRPTQEEGARGKATSIWVVMARDRSDLGRLIAAGGWSVLAADPSAPLWTDDFSNLLSVLSPR